MRTATPEQMAQLIKMAGFLKQGLELVCDTSDHPVQCMVTPNRDTLILDGPQFVFLMLHPERNTETMMTLYLEVDMKSAVAAAIVKTVSNFVEATRWRLGEEFYFDDRDNTVTYGEEARSRKKERFINNNGFATCIFCERVVDQKMVTDSGCPFCKDQVADMLWS